MVMQRSCNLIGAALQSAAWNNSVYSKSPDPLSTCKGLAVALRD